MFPHPRHAAAPAHRTLAALTAAVALAATAGLAAVPIAAHEPAPAQAAAPADQNDTPTPSASPSLDPSKLEVKHLDTTFKAMRVAKGKTLQVPFDAYGAKEAAGTPRTVTWTVSKPGVVQVAGRSARTKSGALTAQINTPATLKLKARKIGKAIIKLTSDGHVLKLTVNVARKVARLRYAYPEIDTGHMPTDQDHDLFGQLRLHLVPKAASATTVKWRSSNPKAFRVDAAGRLTVVGHGRAWIKARYQGHNAQILVSSSNAPWPK